MPRNPPSLSRAHPPWRRHRRRPWARPAWTCTDRRAGTPTCGSSHGCLVGQDNVKWAYPHVTKPDKGIPSQKIGLEAPRSTQSAAPDRHGRLVEHTTRYVRRGIVAQSSKKREKGPKMMAASAIPTPEMTASLVAPCSSRAIRSATGPASGARWMDRRVSRDQARWDEMG